MEETEPMDKAWRNAPCGFFRFSDAGEILEANHTFCALLGLTEARVDEMRIETILSPAGRTFYQTHLFPLLKLRGLVDEVYLTLRSVTGEEVPVLLNAKRHERDGRGENVCVFMRIARRGTWENDLIAAKRLAEREAIEKERRTVELETAKAELERLNAEKNRILGITAHDIRGPVGSILTYGNAIENDAGPGLDVESRKALKAVRETSSSLLERIDDLLDYSTIEAGRLSLDRRPTELSEFIREVIELQRDGAEAKDMEIQFSCVSGLPPASIDPTKFSRVFNNLIGNAIKFSPRGSVVSVTLERDNALFRVGVRDQGPGITAVDLPKLFEAFERGSSLPTGGEWGTGLGLFVAHRIVKAHDGIMAVDTQVGAGSTFLVLLPIVVSQRESPRGKIKS